MRHGPAAPLVAFVLMSPFLANSAGAAPITYTETATATGTLGSTAFTNSQITVSFAGDTSGVTSLAPGILINPAGVTTVAVAGLGTATLTGSVAAVDDQAFGGAGVGAEGSGPPPTGQGGPPSTGQASGQGGPPLILGVNAAAFTTYDLTSAIGPVTGPSTIAAGSPYQTSNGAFVLNSAGDATFTATTAASAVPEPMSAALVGAGLIGLGLARHRARRGS